MNRMHSKVRPAHHRVARRVRGLALAGFVAAALVPAGSALAALPGLSCKSAKFEGVGESYGRSLAKKKAIINWIQLVQAQYGSGWASWGRAANRTESCVMLLPPNTNRWRCRVRARPCRFQRRLSPHQHRPPHHKTPGTTRRGS